MALQSQCHVHRLCCRKELFTYVYMHISVHPNLALDLLTRFLDWRLSHFRKELFVCCISNYMSIISQKLSSLDRSHLLPATLAQQLLSCCSSAPPVTVSLCPPAWCATCFPTYQWHLYTPPHPIIENSYIYVSEGMRYGS